MVDEEFVEYAEKKNGDSEDEIKTNGDRVEKAHKELKKGT
jgi:hypothetical protein